MFYDLWGMPNHLQTLIGEIKYIEGTKDDESGSYDGHLLLCIQKEVKNGLKMLGKKQENWFPLFIYLGNHRNMIMNENRLHVKLWFQFADIQHVNNNPCTVQLWKISYSLTCMSKMKF